VSVNITLSINEQIVERAREKLRALGKSVNEEIRDHLRHVAGDEDEEIERAIEFLRSTAGQGKPEPGWKWNRDELYEDRIKGTRS